MNDEELHGPRLSPAPPTSPIVRGAAVALVTVALGSVGCFPGTQNPPESPDASNPGARVFDGGIYAADGGVLGMDSGLAPGVPAQDSGPDIDAGNPGDHP